MQAQASVSKLTTLFNIYNGFMPDAPVYIRLLPRILETPNSCFRGLLLAPLHLTPLFSKFHRLLELHGFHRLFTCIRKVTLYLIIISNLY